MEGGKSVRNQCCASILMSCSVLCAGCVVGWLSPALETLQGPAAPLGELAASDVALLASLVCLGALLGTLVFGTAADRLGRRATGLCCALPMIGCWAVKLWWSELRAVQGARFAAGAGGAGAMLVSVLYAAEVAGPRCRGALGAVNVLAFNAGILLAYVVGGCTSYAASLWIMLAVPVAYFALFLWMPETPHYLLKTGNEQAAIESLAWLRQLPGDSAPVQEELARIKLEQTLVRPGAGGAATLRDCLLCRATLHALALCLTLVAVQGFAGMYAVVSYASEIFSAAGGALSPSGSAAVLASIQLAGSLASTALVERAGRKVLFALSSAVVSASLAVLGGYFFLQDRGYDVSPFGLVPLAALSLGALSLGALIFSMGMAPVTFVVTSEVFMAQVSGMATSLVILWLWLASFLVAQFYSATEALVGRHGTFWGFAGVALFGAAFSLVALPETRSRSLEDIVQLLAGKRAINKPV